MPSAPKKAPTPKKNSTLSVEEQTLIIKKRREVIEQRLVRLQAKIDKDRALLQKYTAAVVPPDGLQEEGGAADAAA